MSAGSNNRCLAVEIFPDFAVGAGEEGEDSFEMGERHLHLLAVNAGTAPRPPW